MIDQYKEKVIQGGSLEKEELMALAEAPLENLCAAADDIRRTFCGSAFDLCAVISAKGGPCSEDCKFCAQSGTNPSSASVPLFSLLPAEKLIADAVQKEKKGVMAYGVVTSGRALPSKEVELLCQSIRKLEENTNLRLCASLGLLHREDLENLARAGLHMIHNNLESSEKFFQTVCTTHTYEEKKEMIRQAKAAGLMVCSGALAGIGETMEDRIELALQERALGVESIPVNMLDPVPGTPFEAISPLQAEEVRKTVAVFRFAMPHAWIRLAAGREYLQDKGRSCFLSGANAAISGDFLTTMGISVQTDLDMLREIGYEL